MRIGLVSYEYAGVAQGGGIGTYMRNTAAMLAARGHEVEVFTAVQANMGPVIDGVVVHAVESAHQEFPKRVLEPFAARHRDQPFNVVEAREYGAHIDEIVAAFPDVARVVKLATAGFIISRINNAYVPWKAKARFVLGALCRGRLPQPYWHARPLQDDRERAVTLAADEVTSPSRALLDLTRQTWPLNGEEAHVIPHVFQPPPSLVALDPSLDVRRITFIGKLEVRKGVIELAHAFKSVRKEFPDAQLRFVGRSLPYPGTGEDMEAFLRRILGRHTAQVEFTGGVPYDQLSGALADSGIAVFPSYWEAYGFVCLEAMAAARGVIGSSAGGMAEIIEHGRTGLLVPPRDPKAIAEAILTLLRDPQRRLEMGRAARQRVIHAYAPAIIGPLQEASYIRAMERARLRKFKAARDKFAPPHRRFDDI